MELVLIKTSELYKLYDIQGVPSNQPGVSKKIEIVKRNTETGIYEKGIFKEKLNFGSKDNVIEAIVYRIAQLVGVPCARAIVIKHKGEIGSFSRYEIDKLDDFIHLQDYLGSAELFADDFFDIIRKIKCNNVKQIYARDYQYVLLDYLVGQQDRHMENLALIGNRNNMSFYPLYDNGLALYGNRSNSMYKKALESNRFESRMGSSEDIYDTLKDVKSSFKNIPLESIIKLSNIDRRTLDIIIEQEDKYKELIVDRRQAMVDFILIKKEELSRI